MSKIEAKNAKKKGRRRDEQEGGKRREEGGRGRRRDKPRKNQSENVSKFLFGSRRMKHR